MIRRPASWSAALLLCVPAAAQDVPTLQLPVATPTPAPAPFPSPVFTQTPVPTQTPSPSPTRTPSPTPRATATPRTEPSPRPTPTATPTPALTPTPTPTATVEPIETVVLPQPQPRPAAPIWPWLAGAAALALLAATGWFLRRRRVEADEPWEEPEPFLPAVPEPVADPPPPTATPMAVLALDIEPSRAGLNLISATVACEVRIANVGDAPAEDIRAEVRLMSARERHREELAPFFAAPIGRPEVPAFTLQPGEERRFRAVAALGHEAIHPLQAGDRQMFVPVLALSAHYRAGGEPRRIGQAWAIGIRRAAYAKLAPFWLDTPPRQYDSVAARPHGPPEEG